MKKLNIIVVFGTRPEAIKMAPLVKELRKHDCINTKVCVTAQHRQMLDQVLDIFNITPDFDLDIMKQSQTLFDITTNGLEKLGKIFFNEKPDMVLVHGDTTTTFVGGLAAFYNKIKIGHVEAGLRTHDRYSPFPEEVNRRLTGVLADIHFSPTISNKNNLLKEGICENDIVITGNTVIDALKTTVKQNYVFENRELQNIDFQSKKIITVTAHRRENLGKPLENICTALRDLIQKHSEIEIVYPVHLNPQVQKTVVDILGEESRVRLINPLDVEDMHNLMNKSYFIMTDSGGLQEEAPSLGKPVIVLRNETERPEAAKVGTVKVAGTERENIFYLANQLIENKIEYDKMSKAINPYGDGKASQRIVQELLYRFGYVDIRPQEFTN